MSRHPLVPPMDSRWRRKTDGMVVVVKAAGLAVLACGDGVRPART